MKRSAAKSVLVLEDDDSIRDVLCLILEGLHYSVLSSGDEKGFRELVRRRKFDMFITDLDLQDPKFDGVDAAAFIRKLNSEIPVVLITAQSSGHHKVRTFRRLISKAAVIYKPFSVIDLEETLVHMTSKSR
jgi:DNA-binding NtrC family response regulator